MQIYIDYSNWRGVSPSPVAHLERFLNRYLLPHLSDDEDRGMRASALTPLFVDLEEIQRRGLLDLRPRAERSTGESR